MFENAGCRLHAMPCKLAMWGCWTQGVAKHFREIFAQLVPGGKGELVMQKPPARLRQARRQQRPPQPRMAQSEEDEEGTAERPPQRSTPASRSRWGRASLHSL